MERRLIQYGLNGPSEGPVVPDGRELAEDVERMAERQRLPLSDTVGRPLVQEAVRLAENPDALRMRVSKRFEDVPHHVNAIAESYSRHLTPERRTALLEGVTNGDTLGDELEGILDAVTVPVDMNDWPLEHRYLRGKEAPEGFPSWYGIDFRKVEADRRIVAGLRKAHPEYEADLAEIERALSEYARPDPSLPADRWGLIQRNAGDQKVLGMAKYAAIIIAGFAAVTTGIIALGKREGFKAPLLYAAIAGLLAFPDMRRAIFGSKAENVLAEVDGTVNARDFKESVRTYDIAGDDWRSFADDVMHSPTETRQFLRDLSRHPVDSPLNKETIDDYVNTAMPEGPAREQLRQMIMDKRFPVFAERLMLAKNEDARDVVLEYIGRGAGRFERLAHAGADEANRLYAEAPRPYLGGNLNASEYQ